MARLTEQHDTHVLVLGGGPDAERDVSIQSARGVAQALNESQRCTAELELIDAPDAQQLREMAHRTGAKLVFPVLHGRFGEGGPLQRALDQAGLTYVGSGVKASRLAIDKAATKAVAAQLMRDPSFSRSPIEITATRIVDPTDDAMPLEPPFVIKPNFEGSTIGLHIVKQESTWKSALAELRARNRPTIAEPFAAGDELTVAIVDRGSGLKALPIVRITPAGGLYDYQAKYERDDTRYEVGPQLADGVTGALARFTESLANRLGVRHLARADFILDRTTNIATFLEINTMPGFTTHSLVPMSARAIGLSMTALCETLVDAALRDAPRTSAGRSRSMAAAG